jgi:hypothetical protein
MMKTWTNRAVCAAAVLILAGCSNEISKSASPVELIATNTQNIFTIDIAPGAPNCNRSAGTIEMQAITKNPSSGTTNTTFNQVRIQSYTVSYVRTDGGKLVPASFTNAMDSLLTPGGGATSLTNFQIFRAEALNLAPFAALLPQNGGRDPDTQQSTIRMDIVVTVFGQTLAGENVSASTRFPMAFCYNCGGCA